MCPVILVILCNQMHFHSASVQKTDKPKNLKDLLGGGGDNKPKPKKKEKEVKQNKNKYDEPKKLTFINSKKKGNEDEEKKKKDNEAEKPKTKNYLDIDKEKKKYTDVNEDIAKPQFTTNKTGDENFVELNKDEDVSIFLIFIFFFI